MNLDLIFSTANFLAIAGWIMLAVLPGRAWVIEGVVGGLIPLLLSVAYAGLIAAFWSGAEGGFSSLDDVARLFQTPGLLLAGWLHYLASTSSSAPGKCGPRAPRGSRICLSFPSSH